MTASSPSTFNLQAPTLGLRLKERNQSIIRDASKLLQKLDDYMNMYRVFPNGCRLTTACHPTLTQITICFNNICQPTTVGGLMYICISCFLFLVCMLHHVKVSMYISLRTTVTFAHWWANVKFSGTNNYNNFDENHRNIQVFVITYLKQILLPSRAL